MRVVIAEDELLLREGLARLLDDNCFDVVATAGDGEDLVRKVAAHKPDVAITDIRMPPTFTDEGVRAAARLAREHPETGVLVLSHHVDPDYAMELLEGRGRGGSGYLLKQRVSDLDRLTEAIRLVAAGGVVVDPLVAGELVAQPRTDDDPLAALSARELELLGLMAEGLSNAGLAERLFLSKKTIETHVHNILIKLELPQEGGEHRRVLAVLTYLRARPAASR